MNRTETREPEKIHIMAGDGKKAENKKGNLCIHTFKQKYLKGEHGAILTVF